MASPTASPTASPMAAGPADPPRVAYAVGRPVGGAVARNRVRRRLRAIVHDLGPELPPGAYLVRAAPGAATLAYADLRASVTAALRAVTAAGTPEDGS